MKNTYKRMLEDKKFAGWVEAFRRSANYHMALEDGNQVQEDALLICLAYAYEWGTVAHKEKAE
jgi:3-phenylpropionate/cinnamic acid dioxygenase small subunit